jgi:Elongation factor G C-terminus
LVLKPLFSKSNVMQLTKLGVCCKTEFGSSICEHERRCIHLVFAKFQLLYHLQISSKTFWSFWLFIAQTCLPICKSHKYYLFCLNYRAEGTTVLKYKIPTRGLLGLRNSILTASRGTAILNTIFDSYGPWTGDFNTRDLGSLVKHFF